MNSRIVVIICLVVAGIAGIIGFLLGRSLPLLVLGLVLLLGAVATGLLLRREAMQERRIRDMAEDDA